MTRMSENTTDKIRRDIMKGFLRSIVWIDDEIRPDSTEIGGDLFRSFFYPTALEFQKQKLLVHLHPFVPDTSGDGDNTFDDTNSESLESAAALAKKADVVVLDWHLGRTDPTNSIEILTRLKEESAIRYVIVLSKFDNKFATEMKNNGMLKSNSSKSINSHLFQRIGDSWANDQGTHIIVMKKPNAGSYSPGGFCESVINAIFDLMCKANPDYLQWAAIEIAAKLRISIPGWIRSIPRGTDAAILSELSSEYTEARDFIPEHLLEDLAYVAKLNNLTSLQSENCKPEHWKSKIYEPQLTLAATSERYQKFVHFALPASRLDKKDVASIQSKLTQDKPSELFLESQNAFEEFCENMSNTLELFPTFGSVYIKEKKGRRAERKDITKLKQDTIYICVSQECDAKRCGSLMLLEGSVAHASSGKEGITKLSLQGKAFGFLPEAKSLRSVAAENSGDQRRLSGFEKVGQLRKAAARRILYRFWNYVSRSAVNLSRFTLKDREGE